MRRNRFDIGRMGAAMIAVIMLVYIPAQAMVSDSERLTRYTVRAAADELTMNVRQKKKLTAEAYDGFINKLNGTGRMYDVQMTIGKRQYSIREDAKDGLIGDEAFSNNKIMPCAGHVHSADCYAGHNHLISGCSRHEHTSECYCQGRLTHFNSYQTFFAACPVCNGYKVDENGETCSQCMGQGMYFRPFPFYDCSVCGKGLSREYGEACTRRTCGYVSEGYQCGITENDTIPVCGRVIVDVTYKDRFELYRGDSLQEIDTEVKLAFLDGSEGLRTLEIIDESLIDTNITGELVIELKLEGLLKKASNNEIRKLPVYVTVKERTITCPKCGNIYYCAPDGSDPGCPYCYVGPVAIRAALRKSVYSVGDELSADVFLIFDDHEEQIPMEEYWDTFDSDYPGTQTVIIGYAEFTTEVTVYVQAPASTPIPPKDDEKDNDLPGDSGETGPGAGGGAGPGGGDSGAGGGAGPGGGDSGADGGAGPGGPDSGHGNSGDGIDQGSEEHSQSAEFKVYLFADEEINFELERVGVINLNEGDSFSVTVRPSKLSFFQKIAELLFHAKIGEITSGVII